MKYVILICAMVVIGCGAEDPSPANVTATYETLSPDGPCIAGYCATRRWGAGSVTNSGGTVAYNVRVWIKTRCEDYAVYSTPKNLGPGMTGKYDTGLYFGCAAESVIVTWDD